MIEIRVVLDTNIVFAGLYSALGASFQVLQAVVAGKVCPVLSVPLLFEYEDVLKRNGKKLGLSNDEIDIFLDNICRLGSFYKIHYLWQPFLPDPKDDHILELAIASKALIIATFNIKDFKNSDMLSVRVISPKQLLEEIQWVL